MPRVTLGVIQGLSIDIVDVLLMLPLSFPDKRTALLAAFSSRFSLGFFAATINLRMSPIAAGVLVGLLTSIPDAIVTKAYARPSDDRVDAVVLRQGRTSRDRGNRGAHGRTEGRDHRARRAHTAKVAVRALWVR